MQKQENKKKQKSKIRRFFLFPIHFCSSEGAILIKLFRLNISNSILYHFFKNSIVDTKTCHNILFS